MLPAIDHVIAVPPRSAAVAPAAARPACSGESTCPDLRSRRAAQAKLDAFTAWTDPEGVVIIQALAVALSNEPSDRLDQRVAGTVSDEDDRCLPRQLPASRAVGRFDPPRTGDVA